MKTEIKRNENEVILTISGRLDTTTAPTLEEIVVNEIGAKENLTLDVHEMEYISSAGLRVLLAAQKKMQKEGSMKLVGVSENVKEVFDMTGFSDILVIE